MQLKFLQEPYYRTRHINDKPLSEVVKKRLKQLELFQALRKDGCSETLALKAIDLSRATLYRLKKNYRDKGLLGLENKSTRPYKVRKPQWSRATEQRVLHLRRQFPLWGKLKIAAILERENGPRLSPSTVGRILDKLLKSGRIKPVHYFYGAPLKKKSRRFNQHAKRWKYGMKGRRPGELIQIDHMSIGCFADLKVKHFKATCPITKITIAQVYSRATSTCAADFLKQVQEKLPFPIISIQVDGGSEFMADFEGLCKEKAIPLFVLPPRKPKFNGQVERGNSTFRYEFYHLYRGILSIAAIRKELQEYVGFYNGYRPHQALNQEAPMTYYTRNFLEAA